MIDGTGKQIKRTYVRKKPYVNWRKEKDSAGPPKDKENEGYEETNKNKWFNSKFTPGFNEPKTLTEDKENIYPISDDESDIDTNSNIDFGKFKDSSRVVASRVTTSDINSKENDSYKNDKIMPDESSNMESTTEALKYTSIIKKQREEIDELKKNWKPNILPRRKKRMKSSSTSEDSLKSSSRSFSKSSYNSDNSTDYLDSYDSDSETDKLEKPRRKIRKRSDSQNKIFVKSVQAICPSFDGNNDVEQYIEQNKNLPIANSSHN